MSEIRDKAVKYLKQVSELGITSNGSTAALFTQLTGATQAGLERNWAAGGHWTTCNEFVGHYGRALGSKDYLGRFDIDTYLKSVGKGHAWIPFNPDTKPKPGDVFLVRSAKDLHMGVSLALEGDAWTTVESGQGGPRSGCDIIKRKNGSFLSRPNLVGWVDIDLYFDAAKQGAPPPLWLQGWWKVYWRSETYYYHFERGNKVRYTLTEPVDIFNPIFPARDVGSYGLVGQHGVTVRWSSTGSIEKFGLLPSTTEEPQMKGTWNDKEQLTAVKM